MYFYFYDNCTQEEKHSSTIHAIEARLVELGINGRIEKLSIFKNAKTVIEDAIKKGAETIVAVGNDNTFTQLISAAAAYEVTIGFIPIENSPRYSELLGIPVGVEACTVLSKRRKVVADVGNANGHSFISAIEVSNPETARVTCNGEYTISSTTKDSSITIMNVGSSNTDIFDCTDGKFDVVVTPAPIKESRFKKERVIPRSIFHSDSVYIESVSSDPIQCTIDNTINIQTPCTVRIIPQALPIIVGKERTIT